MSEKIYASDWAKSPNISQLVNNCKENYSENNDYSQTDESYYATPIFVTNLNISKKNKSSNNYSSNVSSELTNYPISKQSNLNNNENIRIPKYSSNKKNNGSVSASTTTSTGLLLPYKKKKRKGYCCFGFLTRCECFLLISCFLLVLLLLSVSLFWLVLLHGYRLFTDGFNPWATSSQIFKQNMSFDITAVHHHKAVCTSKDCVSIAAFLSSNLNPKIDPCDDFYEFACGNYHLNQELPLNKPIRHTIFDVQSKLQRQLKRMLEEPIKPSDKSWDRLTKKFYMKCNDEISMTKNNDNWEEWPHTWEYQLGDALNKTGLNAAIIEITVSQDPKDSDVHVIEIDQPKWGMGVRWPYIPGHQGMLANYTELLIQVAVNMGATREKAEKDMKEVLEFEMQLVNFSVDEMTRREPQRANNRFQLWQIEQMYPNIKMGDYIKRVFTGICDITPNETLIIREVSYLKGIQFVMSNTPKRVIANYLGFRFIHSYKAFLSIHDREPFYIFRKNQTEMTTMIPTERWDECVSYTSQVLDMPLGKMFVEQFFVRDYAMNKMNELTGYLKESFLRELLNADWMDSKTKERALNKAENIEYKIGYPETLFNDTWMQQYWGDKIPSDREPILQLTIRIKNKRNLDELRRLKKPVDRSLWYQGPAQVDAFYAPNLNEMIFPAGIMQFPFLTPGVPNYITYGMVGAVIGHEVSHAFDDQGGRYDEKGNLHNWWDIETINKFYTKADCFIKQYDSIKIEEVGINLNGRLSLGENIADNSGLKTAYEAYSLWLSNSSSSEPALPGLQNFSSEQLFFLAYANNWCSMVRSQHYFQLIMTDPHAPGKYRAIIPLQNRPEFAKAYNCPSGSPMNPYKKCSVW
ncbi:Phosphate-regulating neutral endopeptidase [Strongyloides ratti]|uniref:Phosphate-regulating neutral endopeptidase n=1 Tax=Strongyloides ratti TaxID=34506 RepID=A0A090L6K1_STRRB|nr:Phosphate-regulating neutral endopeptidase [Strongyloides ratti]CEF63708.1 Phosphate-regulating neutral endopeptidase [Strongyloides ratti]